MSNQATLNQLHEIINNLVTQYVSGILMDIEFAHAVYAATKFVEGADLSNLLDPNTGLRYPTTKSPTN
jgi:hypothetical protein